MNNKHLTSRLPLILGYLAIDALLILGAEVGGFLLRFGRAEGPFPRQNFADFFRLILPIVVLRLLCFFIYGLYDKPKYKTIYDTILNIIKAATASTLVIMVAAFLFRAFAYPRTVIFFSWLLTIFLIIAWRMIARRLINLLLGKDYFISQVLIVGSDHEAQRIATRLLREAHISRRLVGYITPGKLSVRPPEDQLHLGGIADIPRLIDHYPIDEVVIASQMSKETILSIFSLFSQTDVIFRIVPSLYEATIGSMAGSPTELVPMISPISNRMVRYRDMKRLLDTAAAILGLILLSPLMLLIALAVKISSAGPVLYRQDRAGLHGRPFTLYKFRTMFADSEAGGPEFAQPRDPRVTAVGRFLRRFRLDELPQLFNVLINEMSLIGPRPERPCFVRELIEKIPFYAERLEVKPGITGWAQVTYGYSSSINEHREKLLYDIFYLENMSLALDGLIMLKTLGVVLRGKGAQ